MSNLNHNPVHIIGNVEPLMTPASPTKYRTRQVTTQQLFTAALELSLEHGLDGWSLDDLARHISLPLGNLYYYMKRKAEMQGAVIKYMTEMQLHTPVVGDELTVSKHKRLYYECKVRVLEAGDTLSN